MVPRQTYIGGTESTGNIRIKYHMGKDMNG